MMLMENSDAQSDARGSGSTGGIAASTGNWPWREVLAIALIVLTAGLVEHLLGRQLWGINKIPGIWSADTRSEHTSQFLFDPYSFTHLSHRILLYGLTWLAAKNRPVRTRATAAIAIEALWEVVENTPFVIQRYRAETISLHYFGDSIMNSMCDILMCLAGFLIASRLPTRLSILLVIALEVALAFWVHDGLLLNILMLIYPISAIKSWQQM